MNIHIDFQHQHSAHCESGVASALLSHGGLDFDEAMVFGLSSALTFAYLPVVKLAGMPLISYRMPPKFIIRRICRLLDIRLVTRQFSHAAAGMQALDECLVQGKPVGLQTSVFWLPYFPEEMRFHFNAHNLVVYGREGDDYLISDPVFETPQRCAANDLARARFAKGALAAKGLMYVLDAAAVPRRADLDMPRLIADALRKNARQMRAPLFFIGTRGIHTLAKKIAALPQRAVTDKYRKLYLGHIVRMQEEIGTGGAGFRYLYAYFLEQAAQLIHCDEVQNVSQRMTAIGDEWRRFAATAVRQCRHPQSSGYAELADLLHQLARHEADVWQDIAQLAAHFPSVRL